jgi:hypothetical protein
VIRVLVAGGLGPLETARTLSSLTDTLTRRVIELVGAELGPAPGPYAWLALGSDARREQTLHSDQDHALVHAEVADGDAGWFHQLAAGVTDLLEVAGLPRCPGGTMATRWCDPLPVWQRRFETWLAEPDVQALYETGIFLDHRVVAGDLDVGVLDAIVRATAGTRSCSPAWPPPPAPRGRRWGCSTACARTTRGGSTSRPAGWSRSPTSPGCWPSRSARTPVARSTGLAAAREAGALSDEGAEELTEAFGFLLGLRLRAQVAARAAGTEASTLVRVDDLAPGRPPAPQGGVRGDRPDPGGHRAAARRHRGGTMTPTAFVRGRLATRRGGPTGRGRLLALDLETTGLDAQAEILAVGDVPIVDGAVRLGEASHALVRPGPPVGRARHRGPPPAARRRRRRPPDRGGPAGPARAHRAADALVVHHAALDVRVLRQACRATGLRWPDPPVIDTVGMVEQVRRRQRHLGGPRMPRDLAGARASLGLPPHRTHDALADAIATAELYLALRARLRA